MFTSWSELSTPAELSMASVLMRPPRERVLDPRPLGEARGCRPRPTTRQRSSVASMRTASLVRSPTSASDSVDAFTNVPMPPFQSRSTGARRIALHQLVGGERPVADAEHARAPRRERSTDFALRGYTPPPGDSTAGS